MSLGAGFGPTQTE